MSKAINKLNSIIKKLEKSVQDGIKANVMREVGEFAKDIVVKRTRLGYGVTENLGKREKLAALKGTYVQKRKMFSDLDATTTPKKSNLTRTGNMLRSMAVKSSTGTIQIRPVGKRNIAAAEGNSVPVTYKNGYTKPARIFNRISQPEFNQIVRFYRKSFGDLLKKLQLIK